MSTLIQDPYTERALIADRRRKGIDLHDEVWEGVYYVMPNPNVEHQDLVFGVGIPLREPALAGEDLLERLDDPTRLRPRLAAVLLRAPCSDRHAVPAWSLAPNREHVPEPSLEPKHAAALRGQVGRGPHRRRGAPA